MITQIQKDKEKTISKNMSNKSNTTLYLQYEVYKLSTNSKDTIKTENNFSSSTKNKKRKNTEKKTLPENPPMKRLEPIREYLLKVSEEDPNTLKDINFLVYLLKKISNTTIAGDFYSQYFIRSCCNEPFFFNLEMTEESKKIVRLWKADRTTFEKKYENFNYNPYTTSDIIL